MHELRGLGTIRCMFRCIGVLLMKIFKRPVTYTRAFWIWYCNYCCEVLIEIVECYFLWNFQLIQVFMSLCIKLLKLVACTSLYYIKIITVGVHNNLNSDSKMPRFRQSFIQSNTKPTWVKQKVLKSEENLVLEVCMRMSLYHAILLSLHSHLN